MLTYARQVEAGEVAGLVNPVAQAIPWTSGQLFPGCWTPPTHPANTTGKEASPKSRVRVAVSVWRRVRLEMSAAEREWL